jgi:hypothetical protein
MSKKKEKEKVIQPENQLIESEVWVDVTFLCPVRGKVTQKVRGIRYKAQRIPDRQINYEYDFLKEEEEVHEFE